MDSISLRPCWTKSQTHCQQPKQQTSQAKGFWDGCTAGKGKKRHRYCNVTHLCTVGVTMLLLQLGGNSHSLRLPSCRKWTLGKKKVLFWAMQVWSFVIFYCLVIGNWVLSYQSLKRATFLLLINDRHQDTDRAKRHGRKTWITRYTSIKVYSLHESYQLRRIMISRFRCGNMIGLNWWNPVCRGLNFVDIFFWWQR